MARDPYIEQRLINWGRMKAGRSGGGLGYASTAWGAFDGGDRYSTRPAVIADDEEAITDQAVQSLAEDLQEALEHQFALGGTIEAKATRVGCHPETFRRRVDAGMHGVSRWLTERERAHQAQRDAIESMQRMTSEDLAARVTAAVTERARTDKILGIKARRVRKSG